MSCHCRSVFCTTGVYHYLFEDIQKTVRTVTCCFLFKRSLNPLNPCKKSKVLTSQCERNVNANEKNMMTINKNDT